ncbi:MAG: PD-(D/E)XK nuclease family protein [bacterium]
MLLEETGRNGSEKQREAVPEAFEEMPETNPEAFGGSPENEIRRQISAFVESGRMEAGDAAAVETRDIAAFVRSNLGQRFIRAAKAGKLRREQPFAMEAAANTIRPEYPSDETILVQGIIDAYFFETNARGGEEIVLVDYKTDRVFKASQLIERYKLQLDAYADALIRATGLPVSEKIIWSFCLGSEIRVP